MTVGINFLWKTVCLITLSHYDHQLSDIRFHFFCYKKYDGPVEDENYWAAIFVENDVIYDLNRSCLTWGLLKSKPCFLRISYHILCHHGVLTPFQFHESDTFEGL